jgi:hypothetical protein
LATCVVLAAFLGVAYLFSQPTAETLTQEDATAMLQKMQEAVAQKNVNAIMSYIAPQPETRIANLNLDQLRLLLARAFHNSGTLHADYSKVVFTGGSSEATLEFDLVVANQLPGVTSDDYKGHVTLHLKRVDVPRLFGLFHSKEWRIAGADSTGPDLMDLQEE